ncbi:hypothetical protein AB0E06_33600 [Streptomyces sp. NPDC048109]|uniref:VMAP-C domain-containing protein n=1 Tax=Streptomyces sp. NPDC048109 TaxID=3155482 RepID=UPI003433F1C1
MTVLNDLVAATLCPERTFALVVGVERYAIDPTWNLRGAARDALRFAQWLTGSAKVPAANVRLLLSPVADEELDWSATPELTALGELCRPATEENVKNALLVELAQCDGDMLWIYWAGHGFLGPRRDMMLACADADAGQVRHLNLDSALNWWGTDKVHYSRFPLQAVLVDACRIDPRESGLNFGSNDYGSGNVQAGRRQFMLYASRPGEAAKNDTERQAGQFTEALLDELAGRSLPDSVSDLADIGRAVHDRFKELHRRGEAWQLPQFIKDRGWDACSFLDDGMPHAARAARLDQRAWDGLGEAFADRPLSRHTHDAYAWAFRAVGCTAPVREGLPGDSLIDIARDLDERHGRNPDMPLTVPFVRFLAERAGPADSAWARELLNWVEETRDRLGVAALPPPPPPHCSTVLHLRLDPAGEETYRVRMWRRRETVTSVWESGDRPLCFDEVCQALGHQLKLLQAESGANGAENRSSEVERVEFHVPFELLDIAFDRWEIPAGRGGRTRPLGVLHHVVVRCPEERENARAAWERKWGWLRTQGGRYPEAVRLVKEAQLRGDLGVRLRSGKTPACLVADLPGPQTEDLLDAVLESGVPAAVWWRGGTLAADNPDLREELTRLLEPNEEGRPTANVLALPQRVHELRLERVTADSGLTLLWDDPDCMVETQSLRGSPAKEPARAAHS